MNDIQHWIDGKVVESTSGRTGVVFNPATGQQSGSVALASVAEVDVAVASAKAAFPEYDASYRLIESGGDPRALEGVLADVCAPSRRHAVCERRGVPVRRSYPRLAVLGALGDQNGRARAGHEVPSLREPRNKLGRKC